MSADVAGVMEGTRLQLISRVDSVYMSPVMGSTTNIPINPQKMIFPKYQPSI